MKKSSLLLLTAAAFLGLAACGNNNGDASDATSETTTSEATTSESTVDYASLANAAIEQVSVAYNSWATSGITTSKTLYGSTTVSDNDTNYTFNFTYAIDTASEGASKLSISEADATTGNYRLILATDDTETISTMSLTAYYDGTAYGTYSFKVKVLAVNAVAIEDIYSMSANESVTTYGYFLGTYNYGGANKYAYIGDGQTAIMAYYSGTPNYDGISVGSLVSLTGTIDIYNGLRQIASPTIVAIEETDVPGGYEPEATTNLTIDSSNAFDLSTADESTWMSRYTILTDATVASVSGASGSNLTIRATIGDYTYTIYEHATYCAGDLYNSFLQTRSGASEATVIQQGDTITVEGWASTYSSGPQLIGAKVTSWTEGTTDPDAPTNATIGALYEGYDADTKYTVQGYVTGMFGTSKNGIFVSDGEDSIMLYGYTGTLNIGDCISMTGAPTIYSGTVEFVADSIETVTGSSITAEEPVIRDIASAEGIAASNQASKVTGTGIVQEAKTGTYGSNNITINLTVGNGKTLPIYVHKYNTTETQYNAWTALGTGDLVEFEGFIGDYESGVTTLDALAMSGVQIVNPTVVSSTAAASITTPTVTNAMSTLTSAADESTFDTYAYITGSYSSAYRGIFIGEGAYGGLVYGYDALPLGLVGGEIVHVAGTIDIYNSLYEITDVTTFDVIPSTAAPTLGALVTVTSTADLTLANLSRPVLMSGTFKSVSKSSSGNVTAIMTVGETEVTVYAASSSTTSAQRSALEALTEGASITVSGFVGNYNTNVQIVNPTLVGE